MYHLKSNTGTKSSKPTERADSEYATVTEQHSSRQDLKISTKSKVSNARLISSFVKFFELTKVNQSSLQENG